MSRNPLVQELVVQGHRVELKENSVFIFDSLFTHFFLRRFLKQIAAHLFLPFIFLLENPRAQGFAFSNVFQIFSNLGLPICVYLAMVSYFSTSGKERADVSFLVVIPLMFFLMNRLLIATKYASLSKTEYQRFIESDVVTGLTYQEQMSLVSAWSKHNQQVFMFELGCASVRCGVAFKNMSFSIPKLAVKSDKRHLYQWNALMRGHTFLEDSSQLVHSLKLQADESYLVSLNEILQSLFLKASRSHFSNDYKKHVALSAASISCAIPLIYALKFLSLHGSASFWYYCYHASATIVLFCFSFSVYEILCVAIFDVARLLKVLRDLSGFIRLNDLLFPVSFPSRKVKDYSDIEASLALYRRSAILGAVAATEETITATTDNNIDDEAPSASEVGGRDSNLAASAAKMKVSESSAAARDSSCSVCMDQFIEESSNGKYCEWTDDVAIIPKVSLHDHQNVQTWTFARLAVQNLGNRFRFRLDIYTGSGLRCIFFVVICIRWHRFTVIIIIIIIFHCCVAGGTLFVLIVLMVGMLLGAALSSQRARYQLLTKPFFPSILFVIGCFELFFVVYSIVGAGINECLRNHRLATSL
jgi:hypothetical protein